jgi:hypothetical protein
LSRSPLLIHKPCILTKIHHQMHSSQLTVLSRRLFANRGQRHVLRWRSNHPKRPETFKPSPQVVILELYSSFQICFSAATTEAIVCHVNIAEEPCLYGVDGACEGIHSVCRSRYCRHGTLGFQFRPLLKHNTICTCSLQVSDHFPKPSIYKIL